MISPKLYSVQSAMCQLMRRSWFTDYWLAWSRHGFRRLSVVMNICVGNQNCRSAYQMELPFLKDKQDISVDYIRHRSTLNWGLQRACRLQAWSEGQCRLSRLWIWLDWSFLWCLPHWWGLQIKTWIPWRKVQQIASLYQVSITIL